MANRFAVTLRQQLEVILDPYTVIFRVSCHLSNDQTAAHRVVHIEWQHDEVAQRQIINRLLDLKLRNHNRGQIHWYLSPYTLPVIGKRYCMVEPRWIAQADQETGV